jgi:hypothetical protein
MTIELTHRDGAAHATRPAREPANPPRSTMQRHPASPVASSTGKGTPARRPRGRLGLAVVAALALAAMGAAGDPSPREAPPKTACEGARAPVTSELSYRLENGAFPGSDGPDVAVHVPPGFDASRRPGLVLYFHGFRGCASAALGGSDTPCRQGGAPRSAANLAAQVDEAGVNALVVAVELRPDAPTGEPGRLAEQGALRQLLQELLSARLPSALGCPIEVDALDRVVVIAHSGGYRAAAAALQSGGVPGISEVVLLDALYGEHDIFEHWVEDDAAGFAPGTAPRRRWVDLYTCCAGTANASKEMARAVEPRLASIGASRELDDGAGDLDPAALQKAVVFKRVPRSHQELPRTYARDIVGAAGFAPLHSR